jgi:uncharacterized protein
MRFWDASAIVPLLLAEPGRDGLITLLERDADVIVWWGTPVECASAIARRERPFALAFAEAGAALGTLVALSASWSEVVASDAVRTVAQRLLRVHPLRAADSLQLAAAIIAAEGDPRTLPFVCLDSRLGEAAEREGFTVTK